MDANVAGLHGEQGSEADDPCHNNETSSAEGRRRLERLSEFIANNGFEMERTEWTHTWMHPGGKTFYRTIDYLATRNSGKFSSGVRDDLHLRSDHRPLELHRHAREGEVWRFSNNTRP